MNLSFNLALSYRYLKDPTSSQNFEDTLGQIPKLILTLRLKLEIFGKIAEANNTGSDLYRFHCRFQAAQVETNMIHTCYVLLRHVVRTDIHIGTHR